MHGEEVQDVSRAATAVADVPPSSPSLSRVWSSSLARDAALVSAVSLVLGLVRLGAPSFWIDETFTAAEMRYSLIDKLDVQYHFLYLVLIQPWAAVVGSSEWALRLPSVLGAMAAVGLLVVLGTRLFDRRVGLVGGLLLATSPFFVKWSQQARPYTMFVALCLLTMLLLLRAFDRGTRGAWAAFGVALSVVMIWQPAAALVMLPVYAVFVVQRRDRFLPHGLLGLVIAGAVGLPWAAITAMRSTGEGVNINWIDFPTAHQATWALLDVSGIVGLGVVLAAVGVWMLLRSGRSQLAVSVGFWAVGPFAVSLAVSALKPIYLDRFLSGAAPAFALLAAVALVGLGPKLRVAAVAAVVAATAVGLAQWYAPTDDGNWRGEDWRSAVRTVLELRQPGDDVVVAPWWAFHGAEYYGAHPNDTSFADSIWVLNWSETGHRLPAEERAGLGFGDHVLVETRDFGRRLQAQHWERPGRP
jgi:mannosyltransferase